jgi:hypothetical protein
MSYFVGLYTYRQVNDYSVSYLLEDAKPKMSISRTTRRGFQIQSHLIENTLNYVDRPATSNIRAQDYNQAVRQWR